MSLQIQRCLRKLHLLMTKLNLDPEHNQICREGKSCHLCFLPSVASVQNKISKATRSIGRTKKYMYSNCPTLLKIWIKPFKIQSNSLLGRKAIHRQPGRICTITPESYSFKSSHLRCLDNGVPWVFLFCSACISTIAKEKLNTQRIKICYFFTNTREHGKCLKVRMACPCLYSLWAISVAVDIQYWVS